MADLSVISRLRMLSSLTQRYVLVILGSVLFMEDFVDAYYCDSGRCNEDEYCCGDNKCCTSYVVWQNWYLWYGLVFFLIMLLACASFWKYRLTYYGPAIVIQGNHQSPYTRLQPHCETEDDLRVLPLNDNGMYPGSHVDLPPTYAKYSNKDYSSSPPSYSQVVTTGPPPPYSS